MKQKLNSRFSLIKQCLLLLCLLFIAANANAQQAYFKNLTVENGLSQSSITTIIQDSRGLMWFGTQDGLNRYDGKNIKVYKSNKDDSTSLISNNINKIIELKNKELLIATGSGVCAYNPVFDKFQAVEESKLEGYNIKSLLEDSKGRIWMGSTLGLFLKNTNGAISSFFDNGQGKVEIINIVENKSNGKIWVVTDKCIYFYDENERAFKQSNYSFNESSPIMNAVYNGNNLLFVTERLIKSKEGSVKVFDINTNSYVKSPIWLRDILKKVGIAVLNSICTLENNTSIITTDNNGFFKIKGDSIVLAYNKTDNCSASDLLSNKILCAYRDKQNRIWIGQELGVSYSLLDNVKFRSINAQFFSSKSIESSDIMSLYVDSKYYVLGTSDDGFYLIDRNTNKIVPFNNAVKFGNQNGVLSVLKLSDNKLIAGSWGSGAMVFEVNSDKLNNKKNIVFGATILSMLKDGNNVWISTYAQGIFKYNLINNSIKSYTTANGLLSNNITSLLKFNNILWLGTGESGVDFFDLNTEKVLKTNPYYFDNKKLSASNIFHMYHDKANNCVWLATNNGLNKFSLATKSIQKYYNEESPTTSSNFYSILPDSTNHLWLSTNKGLVKFNINAQNNDAAFVNYTTADGLQGMEFNQGAYFKDEKGILYFGGLNGFTFFHPREITARKNKLPVFFTNYFNGYKEVKIDTAIAFKKYLKLSHKENSVKLYFNSIDYDHPEKIKYSFFLEGYDDDWRPASIENYADYPLLPPGDYVFKVVAINSDGYVNPEPATLHISISPPWYKTKLAYFSYLFLVVFIGWGYGQLRSASANRQNKKLEKTVEQRTRQLAEKNKDITSSIEYARKIQEALLPATDEIKKGINNLFIFYQPRDIVSGDFYWYYEKGNKKIIAVVDCTGHGVPGAFMSMIGHNLLNQIVIERGILKPSEILNELHNGIEKALKQSHTNSESRDGMDVSICMLQDNSTTIEYAGAYRSLIKISGDTEAMLEKINGDKYPVGGVQMGETRNFTNHILHLAKGDMIYMFTDGYADQFGGSDGKKYMMKSFGELLKECSFLSVEAQQEIIANNFNNWKKSYEQIDDVLVVGFRV